MIDLNDVRPLGSPAPRFDLDAVVASLRSAAGDWVPVHFPNGRLEGDEWRLANISGAPPRKQGSCVIALKGAHAGDWIDFDSSQGGGPLNALEHATGFSGRALIEYAAEIARVSVDNGQVPVSSPLTPACSDRAENINREIAFILSRSVPINGTLAAEYLQSRGLDVPVTDDIRFHPDLTYFDTRTGYPGMVAIVRDGDGVQKALHRTYLAPEGNSKASVPKPRKMLGKVAGGSVRLGAVSADGLLGIAEGIETALSVMAARPELPVWAALSAGNLEQLALPHDAARIVILADNDEAGLRAAERAAQRLHASGRRVWIAKPQELGSDFNDLSRQCGEDAVRQAVDDAVEWRTPAVENTNTATGAPKPGDQKPIGFRGAVGRIPEIRSDDGDLGRVTDRTWGLLHRSNDPPWLYRCAGRPSWVERDDDARPVPRSLTDERLRHVLALLADWKKRSKTGDIVPAYPPAGVVKNLLATPDPNLPVLTGIVTAPVFGIGGGLITMPGYHPNARLLYEPPVGFELPEVPAAPTSQDIIAARELLMDGLLGDFPFTSEAERAHALALLLSPFLRTLIPGPTPLHMIEKPTPGTGATLMVDAISIVTTGASASVMVEGRDEEEWRKRLTAKLRQIPTLLLIDNLRRKLDAAPLAAALTAPFWEDRILGRTEMVRFPIRCCWIATGNNPQVSNEMARRLIRIRLDAHVDQPWRREGFRHANLLAWVRGNRGRLVAACLTLGSAWVAAGMPRHGNTIGGFEGWAEVVGGVLDVAEVPGFLANLDEMYEAADAEGTVWRAFVASWWERHGTAEVGTTDLHELALVGEPPLPLAGGNDRAQRTSLGRALMRMRDRVFAVDDRRLRITAGGKRQRAQRWHLSIEINSPGLGSRSSQGSPAGGELRDGASGSSPEVHSDFLQQDQSRSEPGEHSELIPNTSARAPACTRVPTHTRRGDPGLGSPSSAGSLLFAASTAYASEPGCEPRSGSSPVRKAPHPDSVAWPEGFDAIFEIHGLDSAIDADVQTAAEIWLGMPTGPPAAPKR